MSQEPVLTEQQVIDAITAARGNISEAARRCGVRRNYFKRRLDSSADALLALEDAREEVIDQAEQNIFDRVGSDDPDQAYAASLFIAKTIGKNRGYSERNELTGKDGKDLDSAEAVISELEHKLARLSRASGTPAAAQGAGAEEAPDS